MDTKKIKPESQKIEYKSSWQDDYYEWICGYANAKGGSLYIGINDDGYVVGVKDTRFLLDYLPNKVVEKMGIVIEVEHEATYNRGENIKYNIVPNDIAEKAENLYIRGILTKKALTDIDLDPENTKEISPEVQILFDAAPGLVKQLRKDAKYRSKIIDSMNRWEKDKLINIGEDGALEYVCITVKAYPYGINYNGFYFTRSGGTTRKLNGVPLTTFLLERAGKHWDGMPIPNVSVADLDSFAIDAYRKKAVKRHSKNDLNVSDEQIISDLKLLDKNSEKNNDLMRAAILLFHPDPEEFVTGAYVKIAYFAPEGAYGANKSDDIIYHDEIHGPLMLQADKVVDIVFSKYLKALTSYEGLQRIDTYMTSKEAFREIILNSINHKIYESGNPIQISVYEDRIIVFNQGKWPEDIELEDIYTKKHSSYPHNPNITRAFFESGEIEAYGSGFGKIKIECDKYNAPYPELTITPNGVTVEIKACDLYMKLLKYGRYWKTYPEADYEERGVLVDHEGDRIVTSEGIGIAFVQKHEANPADAKTLKSLDHMSEILSKKLNKTEKENIQPIYQYLVEHDTIDAAKAMELTGKSSSTVNRYFQKLIDLGVIVSEGGSKNTIYRRV